MSFLVGAKIFLLKFSNLRGFSLTIIRNTLVLEALSFKMKRRNGICGENLLAFFLLQHNHIGQSVKLLSTSNV